MIYFTSDLHFWHRAIIEPTHSNRPWATMESMNEGLIRKWNDTVKNDDDIVYVVGDGAMNGKKAVACFERLRGRIRFVRGNHDHDLIKKGAGRFEWVRDLYEATVDVGPEDVGNKVVLCHYPIEVWNNKHKGWLHFHGHSHGNTPTHRKIRGRVDIGADCWDFRPVTFAEARARAMSYRNERGDHHYEGTDFKSGE